MSDIFDEPKDITNMTDPNTIRHSKRRKLMTNTIETDCTAIVTNDIYSINYTTDNITPKSSHHDQLISPQQQSTPLYTTHQSYTTPNSSNTASTSTNQHQHTLHIDCESSPANNQQAKAIWSTQHNTASRITTQPIHMQTTMYDTVDVCCCVLVQQYH